MRPSKRLLHCCWLFALLGLVLALWRLFDDGRYFPLDTFWWIGFGVFLVLVCLDGLLRHLKTPFYVERELPGSMALGAANKVTLRIENTGRRTLQMTVADHIPDQIHANGMPASIEVLPHSASEISYSAHPHLRGDAHFGPVDIRLRSPLGFWDYRYLVPQDKTVKVYPNFSAIAQLESLGHDQQMNQVGIHLMQRRGQGMDFHQLREYRQGDTSRQIDWKASSRQHKIISREYQDERDQDIVFLLDCGRRMRAKDDALSHFDHCLNTLLLVSYVALRQGDAVGVLSFAGDQRWQAPVKGKTSINTLLNSVYNLHSGTTTSDLVEAATELMARHRKRSLVILLTNLREEDRDDVIAATQLLSKKHLVLVASLRENFLDEAVDNKVHDFESSLVYCQASQMLAARNTLLAHLRSKGVIVTDSVPQKLHIHLVNEYWALKRSGRI
jgi:uncharacterized protein (DUF58 family)